MVVGGEIQMLNSSNIRGMQSTGEVVVGAVLSLSARGRCSSRWPARIFEYETSRSRSTRAASSRRVEGPIVEVGGDKIQICASSHTQPIQPGGAALRTSLV